MKVKEGDYVQIVEREVTPADVKTGLYYQFFGGIAGTVDKVYDTGEVSVRVDLDTLPELILKRHLEIQESIRRKWLNGLSSEARNRLSAEEKRFTLAYALLVQDSDLTSAKQGEVGRAVAKTEAPVVKTAARAVTTKDLDDAEEEYIRERLEAAQGEQ